MSARFRVSSFFLLGLILALLAACTAIPPAQPAISPLPPPAATAESIPPAAANAQEALARELGLEPAAVTVVSVEPVDWPDACLGAAGPDEVCGQVVTPGYRITLEAGGRTYVYHTDAAGGQIRPAPEASAGCPANTADETALVQVGHGYCLAYPAGYEVAEPNPAETVLYVGSLLDVAHPKLFIQVEDARGRTAEQVADDVVAAATSGQPGFAIDRTAGVTIAGEPAVRLDGVPGQDLSRQVIAVHDGRAYRLVFVPADEAQGEVYRELETLYELAVRSFRFLPRS